MSETLPYVFKLTCRFVTGGQGDGGGGRISVWNLRPVIDEVSEKNKDVPKLLAQMDHHLGCVNCVRWSFSGQVREKYYRFDEKIDGTYHNIHF